MADLEKQYNSLPEWLRWIAFLPISIIIALLAGGLFTLFVRQFVPDPIHALYLVRVLLINITQAASVQAIFLMAIFTTIPRWKIEAMIFFTVLRSFLLMTMLFVIICTPFGVMNGWLNECANADVFNKQYIGEFVAEIVVLFASIMTIIKIKQKQ